MPNAPIRSCQHLTAGTPKRRLQVVLEEEDYIRFTSFADSLGWSASSLARRACLPYIENAPTFTQPGELTA